MLVLGNLSVKVLELRSQVSQLKISTVLRLLVHVKHIGKDNTLTRSWTYIDDVTGSFVALAWSSCGPLQALDRSPPLYSFEQINLNIMFTYISLTICNLSFHKLANSCKLVKYL